MSILETNPEPILRVVAESNAPGRRAFLQTLFENMGYARSACDVVIDYDEDFYVRTEAAMRSRETDVVNVTFEEVLIQIIADGGMLVVESEDNVVQLTQQHLDDNFDTIPVKYITRIQSGDYDSWDCFNAFQYIAYGEAVYG